MWTFASAPYGPRPHWLSTSFDADRSDQTHRLRRSRSCRPGRRFPCTPCRHRGRCGRHLVLRRAPRRRRRRERRRRHSTHIGIVGTAPRSPSPTTSYSTRHRRRSRHRLHHDVPTSRPQRLLHCHRRRHGNRGGPGVFRREGTTTFRAARGFALDSRVTDPLRRVHAGRPDPVRSSTVDRDVCSDTFFVRQLGPTIVVGPRVGTEKSSWTT